MITIKLLFSLFTLYSGCAPYHSFYDLKGGYVDRAVVPAPSGANASNYVYEFSDNVSEATYLASCPYGHKVDAIK